MEKRGLFGTKKTVMETRTIEVDHKTYKKMMKERKNRPYSLEEMKKSKSDKLVTFFCESVLVKADARGYAVGGPRPERMRIELEALLAPHFIDDPKEEEA